MRQNVCENICVAMQNHFLKAKKNYLLKNLLLVILTSPRHFKAFMKYV